jgi:hypothetical protein
MQLFNVDETGISIVHKPGKVVTELGRRNVWGITSAEKGKTHTIVTCVSASGLSILPMLIYPRKRMTEKLKEGALPGTLFDCSDNGWINQELYLRWLKFFIANIPPARPVLLIQDGHGSHLSLDVIQLARENDIHLLCLPAHTTHLLQPLDVSVFKSLKSNFSKSCKQYLSANPGQVITTDLIALLLAQAWPQSVTPLNAMSGFRKCGIYPLNPGQISDRELAPSRAFVHSSSDSQLFVAQFTQEQIDLFKTRFEEGFDLDDPDYLKWRKIHHPDTCMCSNTISTSSAGDVVSVASPSVSHSNPSAASLTTCAPDSICSFSSQSDTLSEILSLPKPKQRKQKRRGMNTRAVVITDDEVLKELEDKVEQKQSREEEKERKKIERERKKKAQEDKRIVQQQEKEERKMKREQKKQEQERKRMLSVRKTTRTREIELRTLTIACDSSESDAECPKCGLAYKSDDCDGSVWICCDFCNSWYHLSCTDVCGEIPAKFTCVDCK